LHHDPGSARPSNSPARLAGSWEKVEAKDRLQIGLGLEPGGGNGRIAGFQKSERENSMNLFRHASYRRGNAERWRIDVSRRIVMEELNGRMIACQILITGLIARVANDSKDPLSFLSGFRDEILAVVRQVRIAGALDTDRVREIAETTVDELFSLMKPPSTD
jgi:hypothetical protein